MLPLPDTALDINLRRPPSQCSNTPWSKWKPQNKAQSHKNWWQNSPKYHWSLTGTASHLYNRCWKNNNTSFTKSAWSKINQKYQMRLAKASYTRIFSVEFYPGNSLQPVPWPWKTFPRQIIIQRIPDFCCLYRICKSKRKKQTNCIYVPLKMNASVRRTYICLVEFVPIFASTTSHSIAGVPW